MNIIEVAYKWNGEFTFENNPEMIILHHAEASNASVEDVHRWHTGNGWIGIGYHFYVRKNGQVFSGRPEKAIAAHALGVNEKSIGICAEGSYMTETMPEVQKQAIIELCKYLIAKNPNIKDVKRHKDVNSTNCPGNNYPFNEIKSKINTKEVEIKPLPKVMYRVIIDGKQIGAMSIFESAKSDLINIINSDKGKSGKIQRNIDGVDLFTYTKPEPVKPIPQGDDNIKAIQSLCNELGIRDMNGQQLIVDGLIGEKTRYCVAKLPLCGIPYSQPRATQYIQNRLNQLGFKGIDGKPLIMDGVFLTNSAFAVGRYQAHKGLKEDYIVGMNTWLSFLN